MAFEPQGRVAVVTGAAGGIGLGMARAFVDAGMRVVLSDVDADRVEASAASLRDAGHEAVGVRTDVSDRVSVAALAEEMWHWKGRACSCEIRSESMSVGAVASCIRHGETSR